MLHLDFGGQPVLKQVLYSSMIGIAIAVSALGQETSNPLGDLVARQQQLQNGTGKGLSMEELNDMSKHPDENLVENLRQHNFSAISDARWSRFNQWGLFLQIDHCVIKSKDKEVVPSQKLADDKAVSSAYLSMMKFHMAPYPFGSYYFLKEDKDGAPNTDGIYLFGPAAEQRKEYYASKLGLPLNCEDPGVQATARNLADLYTERTNADAARGSQTEDAPSNPGGEPAQSGQRSSGSPIAPQTASPSVARSRHFAPQTPPAWVGDTLDRLKGLNLPREDQNSLLFALNAISDGFKQGDPSLLRNSMPVIQRMRLKYTSECSKMPNQDPCTARVELMHLESRVEATLIMAH